MHRLHYCDDSANKVEICEQGVVVVEEGYTRVACLLDQEVAERNQTCELANQQRCLVPFFLYLFNIVHGSRAT